MTTDEELNECLEMMREDFELTSSKFRILLLQAEPVMCSLKAMVLEMMMSGQDELAYYFTRMLVRHGESLHETPTLYIDDGKGMVH